MASARDPPIAPGSPLSRSSRLPRHADRPGEAWLLAMPSLSCASVSNSWCCPRESRSNGTVSTLLNDSNSPWRNSRYSASVVIAASARMPRPRRL